MHCVFPAKQMKKAHEQKMQFFFLEFNLMEMAMKVSEGQWIRP